MTSSMGEAVLATASALGFGCPRGEGDLRPAAGEDAVMRGEIPDELEMRSEARLGKHAPSVAADRKHLACLDQVVPVEHEGIGLAADRALIDHRLAVVLAGGLELIELEEPVGRREEFGLTELPRHGHVVDRERIAPHEPRIEEASAFGHRQKIVPIERASETLAVEQRIGAHLLRQAPVAIDVGEVKFPARLEQIVSSAEHRRLVDREVDDAVRHDHVEALLFEPELAELLDVALHEADIWPLIAEPPHVP